MQRQWNTVKTFKMANFDIEVAWAYEDLPLSHVFETEEDIEIHQRRCEDYTDTHYVARVLALYDGKEMGSDYLGSCYAYDCDPAVDIDNGIGGYLEGMVYTAISEAHTEIVRLLGKIKSDFLQ